LSAAFEKRGVLGFGISIGRNVRIGVLPEDGRDVQFSLSLGDGRRGTLTCLWASDVTIDLRFASRSGGRPLSSEAKFEEVNSLWRLVFEFPPQGVVELTCNEAHLEYGQEGHAG
jgi:hypothetical protein